MIIISFSSQSLLWLSKRISESSIPKLFRISEYFEQLKFDFRIFIVFYLFVGFIWCTASSVTPHTGQCKRTGGCYNELVVAFYSTGGGVKSKQNLYLLTLWFIYKLAFILFVMTPGAQTTGNIAVYGSAKQLVI